MFADSSAGVPPYGEVGRFPPVAGPDVSAEFGAATTKGSSLTAGKFVDPVGMAVDTGDSTAPDHYAIFVLDNVNPQALNVQTSESLTTLKLEYRIQKLGEHGEVLASRTFALQSSTIEPGLHATSLAVDGPSGRVYALIMDTPPVSGNTEGANAVDRIDAWTTGGKGEPGLAPAVGLAEDDLPEDLLTHAGELAGPKSLQTSSSEMVGDLDGESIAIDGSGPTADLAVGANKYTSPSSTVPLIERFSISGANAGKPDPVHPTWQDAAGTENAVAKAWEQESTVLYSLSANSDGSLNVALGPAKPSNLVADREPNMATVSADLQTTTPVLPWASALEGQATFAPNHDRAATVGVGQDGGGLNLGLEPSGSTPGAGTLAPSVVSLAGEQAFPTGQYAGLVVNQLEPDSQNPLVANFSWQFAAGKEEGDVRSIEAPASLAIRVFDANGVSSATIANATPGGPCNLQGGPTSGGGLFFYKRGSFLALAPGRDGELFALVQSELANTSVLGGETAPIAPAAPLGTGVADQVVEFAPGAGQNGVAGTQCPQPTGAFSITDETQKSAPSTGSGPLTVVAGTKLKFDAGPVTLQGGSPWAYDWDLANALKAGLVDNPWTVDNKFAASPGEAWRWPSAVAEFKYDTPGSYAAKLNLVNDFGTFVTQRTVNVAKAEPIAAAKIAVAGTLTAGQPVSFEASATFPAFDSVRNYHWDFGDGQGEDGGVQSLAQHPYAGPGSYTVKLTITDALGQHAEATQAVTIAPRTEGGGGGGGGAGGGGQTGGPSTSGGSNSAPGAAIKTTVKTTTTAPLTRAQLLARALKSCRKVKAKKRRASCERQAKKRYGPKAAKKKGKKKHR